MSTKDQGLPVSVQTRLQNHAKVRGLEYNRVLQRYALERYLYRLSKSTHADRFVLKGALLLLVWLGETTRATRDADLLGFGELDNKGLLTVFREICVAKVEPDGMDFLPETMKVEDIREANPYGGRRITFIGMLGNARINLQIDVGIGDAIIPEPAWLDYPSLLGMLKPRLRAYRQETAIAEKFQAMVMLDIGNSRMKDFFDVAALASHESFDGQTLANAIKATFERRRTALPKELPLALTSAFAIDRTKQLQWNGFTERNRISNAQTLEATVAVIRRFLTPILNALSNGRGFQGSWSNGGPWE